MPSRRSILKGVLSGIIAAPFVAPSPAFAKAPYAAVQAPGFYRLKIGSVEVTALSDGTVALPLAKLYTNTSQQYAQNVLKDAFLPELVPTSVNAFLVNNGDRLILIDAGTGAYLGPSLGKLVANIEASGYKVDDIDDVILTHIHTDHSGGLMSNGKRTFPNATLRVNEREAKFWLSPENARAATGIVKQHFREADQCVTPYVKAGKFETFADSAAPIPGLGSILYAGHTPGHSAITLESEGQKIVFWGDITHGDILQFDEPGIAIEFDIDQKAAVDARNIAFRQAVAGKYLVAGAHIAFPGIGHVRKDSTNCDWLPVNYS
ncbi:MBL fold metallo-hydrolase [Sinorhizobium meliloti]|uniref:MBL fold metallo-hydrolase n=1 Tax=Rhizobium meliloti TaxID=382 RepID=UPI0002FDB34F|nr:MBL fold metallo-hydrolase [Sinorhizobium meliloti]MDE3876076.1 MBL fold metallo-hydrolase [Sinorhizobium meliloti]MDW9390538.1 MBL fold metallo-hydrolase [Sinorhizobium meliloti]MDW9435201.1 MBL fold metallo-hydrolase [Sinorhizobium meliloti]MDW9481063.1 MBL fold metallo-hydrolase [Sinorhizobium meliloti]MDW9548208.1 MBL fold metallo-hydrolase [Sinorhizobium meliloti]